MRKVLFLFTLLCCLSSNAQLLGPPPPGCRELTLVDDDNDGFALFDLDAYFIQFRNDALTTASGFDLSGYLIEFYPSEFDYNQGTNLITTSSYTNIVSPEQTCYMKLIYSGSGPIYNQNDLAYYFTCHKLVVTPALTTATNQSQHLLWVYPNPVSNILYVQASSQTAFSITIFDLNGKLLIEKQNAATIEVSQLQNGIYLVNIASDGKQFSQKITVAR